MPNSMAFAKCLIQIHKAEGLAEGIAKGKAETARKMKALSLPVEMIAQATGLTPEEIMDLG